MQQWQLISPDIHFHQFLPALTQPLALGVANNSETHHLNNYSSVWLKNVVSLFGLWGGDQVWLCPFFFIWKRKQVLFSIFLVVEYPGNKPLKIEQTKLDNWPPSPSEPQKTVTMATWRPSHVPSRFRLFRICPTPSKITFQGTFCSLFKGWVKLGPEIVPNKKEKGGWGGSAAELLIPLFFFKDMLKFLWAKEQTSTDPAKDNN